ncbi:ABC transporter ATP-binding protein [Paenibacillus donghaensis]|uniref:Multidrug ABC transporter ATP-binding protein n=1 Tax=Paenibacillus donghaensis TaxID=414771 RepID=A0A2Z2KKT0_9BACL|nr:ABC transporter ATP-binding protein [Paenibacillus donghaensis]ASA23019.1 multidrug ABC transporter ATP-binding protein [Paenibacillus donghaensis]
MSILEVEELCKEYKGKGRGSSFQALKGLSLNVESGEFVAIMGPSGSGKTTLLNILSGIDRKYQGDVRISEVSLRKMSGNELALFRRQRMGFVFQDYNLLDSLTLRENVMLPMVLDQREAEEINTRTDAALKLLEIGEVGDKYPYTVSGGQQQRAAISRAVIHEPDVLFADEPTGNLDSKASSTVMKCFARLNEAQGATIVMVTHDPFAASYCSRVIFIKDGEVNLEIKRDGKRTAFLDTILENLAVMGGEADDL